MSLPRAASSRRGRSRRGRGRRAADACTRDGRSSARRRGRTRDSMKHAQRLPRTQVAPGRTGIGIPAGVLVRRMSQRSVSRPPTGRQEGDGDVDDPITAMSQASIGCGLYAHPHLDGDHAGLPRSSARRLQDHLRQVRLTTSSTTAWKALDPEDGSIRRSTNVRHSLLDCCAARLSAWRPPGRGVRRFEAMGSKMAANKVEARVALV